MERIRLETDVSTGDDRWRSRACLRGKTHEHTRTGRQQITASTAPATAATSAMMAGARLQKIRRSRLLRAFWRVRMLNDHLGGALLSRAVDASCPYSRFGGQHAGVEHLRRVGSEIELTTTSEVFYLARHEHLG